MKTEKNKILLDICNGMDFTFLFLKATIRQCYVGKEEKIIYEGAVNSKLFRNKQISTKIFLQFSNAENIIFSPFQNLRQFSQTGLNLEFYHKRFIDGNESCIDDDDILEIFYINSEFSVYYQESDMFKYTILELSDLAHSENIIKTSRYPAFYIKRFQENHLEKKMFNQLILEATNPTLKNLYNEISMCFLDNNDYKVYDYINETENYFSKLNSQIDLENLYSLKILRLINEQIYSLQNKFDANTLENVKQECFYLSDKSSHSDYLAFYSITKLIMLLENLNADRSILNRFCVIESNIFDGVLKYRSTFKENNLIDKMLFECLFYKEDAF